MRQQVITINVKDNEQTKYLNELLGKHHYNIQEMKELGGNLFFFILSQ